MATVISRFRLPVATGPGDGVLAIQGLGSADHGRQVATARWLRMVPWNPQLDELAVVTPTATPVLVRSLAEGSASANVDWGGWLALVAGRARIAPRLWGNAWRALRDGVPKEQATPVRVATWVSALDALGPVRSLDGATRAWFECEDAAAVDRWLGRVDRTPRCAPGPDERWIAQAMTARVLGEQSGRDAERAEALTAIRQASNGRPMVVSEVATAACGLSRRAALPLLASLARERDPAVLAVLLEGLVAHPELARAMELSAREGLIRAPFEAPEGPTLEARVQAIHLAKILGREELVSVARDSEVRAVQRALADDGGLAATPDGAAGASALGAEEAGRGRASVRPDSARSERVRFETDAGRFEIALDGASAPRAIADLRERVRAHRYDGLTFHRVVPGFVAQGGDPRGDGYGGTETPVRTELSMGAFGRGAVGVPLAGLDTGGMQLFVVTEDAPHLDGRYPRIGTVIRGMDVVDGLLPGDRMTRVTLVTEDAPDSGRP